MISSACACVMYAGTDACTWAADHPPAEPSGSASHQIRCFFPIWTAEQLRHFLAFIADHPTVQGRRTYAMWLLLATTGMRRGEVAGLEWSGIDLDRVEVTSPKSDRGRRVISLDPATVAALRSWRSTQAQERLSAGPSYATGDYVFTWEDGAPLHPDVITRTLKRLTAQAGLPVIRCHALRHSYATAIIESVQVDIKVLSERLGHAGIGITLDVYGHVLERQDEAAANAGATFILGAAQ
jgi:integrase